MTQTAIYPARLTFGRETASLGAELGRGAEGAVFELNGRTDLVAKLYLKPLTAARVSKLQALVQMTTPSLLDVTAWPIDVALDQSGVAKGFVMNRLSDSKDIHTLYSPRSRKTEFSSADWRFLIRSAINTAKAFADVHDAGCVIGDINHGSIRVFSTALVKLIDCDSFQVSLQGQTYACEVGTPLFTPPELQRAGSFRSVMRTVNHDSFGLAVIIFQLLAMGRHPFAGRFLGKGDLSLEQAIESFRFPYGSQAAHLKMEAPPGTLKLSELSNEIATLFEQAFSPVGSTSGRPTPRHWISGLARLETSLQKCSAQGSHYYYKGLSECPWCRLEGVTGVTFFGIDLAGVNGLVGQFDLNAIWQQILAVGTISAIAVPNFAGTQQIAADKEAFPPFLPRLLRAFGTVLILIAALGLIVLFPSAWFVWLAASLYVVVQIHSGPNSELIAKYKARKTTAEGHLSSLKQLWEKETSAQRFEDLMRELERVKESLNGLEALRQTKMRQLEQERRNKQLDIYLDRHLIELATIAGIGSGRKAVLQSYGIESALDVGYNMRVPGIGEALRNNLIAWRQTVSVRSSPLAPSRV